MGRRLGFAALSQKVYTKIVILLCLILILGSAGIAQMVFAIPEYLDKGLNPIPYSPAPPKNLNKISSTVDVTYSNGYRVYNSGDGWRSVSPEPLPTGETVPAKLNAYAACKSINEISGNTTVIDNMFKLGYISQTGLRTSSLLMYPQIKDIIPPVATINSAIIISSQYNQNGMVMPVEAYEITSNWDPRTFSGQMPTLSQQPIGTGTFDETSTTTINRTIDVTSTVQAWFNGTSSQWGFYIKTSSLSTINNDYVYPPRLYIDYTMPEGSFSTGEVSGGTWYNDNICPGMWIPRRASYISKVGILSNEVNSYVLAASTMKPPFGYDNQSFRWVVGGKPMNPNIQTQAGYFNIESESTAFLSNVIWKLPAANMQPFGMVPNPPTSQPSELLPTLNGGSGDILSTLPPPPDNDDQPSDDPIEVRVCFPWEKWYPGPPPVIQPPPPEPEPGVCSSQPPTLKMPPAGSIETYSWSNMKNQWITFSNNNPDNPDLTEIQIGAQDWLKYIKKPNTSGRIAPCGNSDLSFAPNLGNTFDFSTIPNQYSEYKTLQ